jgi:uncharacterized repeat protein (TIGR03803 family)
MLLHDGVRRTFLAAISNLEFAVNARMMKLASTLVCVTVAALGTDLYAQARYETVHTFSGDRGHPIAALTEGPDGRLYGITRDGGFRGKGTVFVTDGGGYTTTIHEFDGTDGEAPYGRLLVGPDGLLYGTTSAGGDGFGTIFRMMLDGSAFQQLVRFTGGDDGLLPRSGLVLGTDGALYGTTLAGGAGSVGTIFRLTTAGEFSTLASFDGSNGALPSGDLIATPDGLYGTTSEGGAGFGTVFHATWDGIISARAVFDPLVVADIGLNPTGGVVLASDGNLYGTTSAGGAYGMGTIFGIIGGELNTLHSFSGADGASPAGALRELSDGNLYGTASAGTDAAARGTIFRLSLDHIFTSVVSFGVADGSSPTSGVIQKISGAIYGTTEVGGLGGFGTVFELLPDASIRTAAHFSGAAIADPIGGVIQASDGNFYGIVLSGGAEGLGAVFRMAADGAVEILASFPSIDGLSPTGALMQASDGHLYGTTEGGPTGDGGVFRVTLGGTLTTIGLFNSSLAEVRLTGGAPSGRLIEGSDGYLYGTTLFGADGAPGGVFRVDRAAADPYEAISVVATLAVDGSQGIEPTAGVTEAPDGTLYGTARFGGADGFGTVFRVSGGAVSTVASFNGTDGSAPASPLLIGRDGNLYGTTTDGGEFFSGTLFRVILDGTDALSALVAFDGINGFFAFQQGLVETSAGVFFGTTMFGGAQGLGSAYQWSETEGIILVHSFDGVSADQPNATLVRAADGALYGTAFGPQGGTIYRFVSDRAAASLTVTATAAVYGGSTSLTATLTVSGAPLADAQVTFSLNDAVHTALTNAAGIASLTDVSVAGLDAGSYPVAASFAGNADAQPATAAGSLFIARATPIVTVQSATFVYDGQPHPATGTVTGIGGEALGPLTFTYNGSSESPVNPGTYAVVGSFAGAANYEAASATAVITILPAPAGLSGLVAAYGFNEGAGSIAGDASGRGHFGRIRQARWAAGGRFGRALDFDGIDDWVTVRDAAALDIRYGITLEAWVKPRSLGGWNTIVLKESDDGLAYALYANDDVPRPAGYVRVAGIDQSVAGFEPLRLNEWTHVAMTYDGAMMRLFVNGYQVSQRPLIGRILSTDEALRIGGNDVWGEFFNGLIDEVRIYARALSAWEIRRDMKMPVAFEAEAPSVKIASPRDGDVLYGTPTVTVMADDNFGLSSVQLLVDGVEIGRPDATAPFTFRLDLANGTYDLTAVALDLAGNSAVSDPVTDPVTVTINNRPKAAYDFDEDSGTLVVDASGHGNHGTMSSGVRRVADPTRGRVLSFNGYNGLVSVADADSLDLSRGMTLEAWVRPTALSGWRTVILKERTDGLAYALYANDDEPWPAGYVNVAGEDRAVRGERRLPLYTWTHLAMTYDGEMLRLFVNGVEVEDREQSGAVTVSDGALRIGGNNVWGEWFQGQIDDVRIYDVAVGAAQIAADMNR